VLYGKTQSRNEKTLAKKGHLQAGTVKSSTREGGGTGGGEKKRTKRGVAGKTGAPTVNKTPGERPQEHERGGGGKKGIMVSPQSGRRIVSTQRTRKESGDSGAGFRVEGHVKQGKNTKKKPDHKKGNTSGTKDSTAGWGKAWERRGGTYGRDGGILRPKGD